jgi:WD40 repeat protein
MKMKHLIVTVHGIRTFGSWQERLDALLSAGHSDRDLTIINYKFGYFSVLAFLFPPLRWLVVRRFRYYLLDITSTMSWNRIDLICHSFGTHIIAWALYGIPVNSRPEINSIIFAASVLKSNFPWQSLIGHGVHRVINDCGTRDVVLILNQVVVLFTGMAGRLGFNGGTGRSLRNRFFQYGHSAYFLTKGKPDDSFMQRYWVPLLVSDISPEPVDFREQGALSGIELTLLNNAEPIKLVVYLAPFVGLTMLFYNLYSQAEDGRKRTAAALEFATAQEKVANEQKNVANEQKNRALLSQSRILAEFSQQQRKQGDSASALALALEALPDPRFGTERPWLLEADASLASALLTLREHAILRGHRNHISSVSFSPHGNSLLTASHDHTIRLSDVATRQPVRTFDCKASAISGASFSPNGQQIVAASSSGTACIFEVATGAIIRELAGSGEELRKAKYSSDGSRIVTTADNDAIRLWNSATGDRIAGFDHPKGKISLAAFSPDGALLLTVDAEHVIRAWGALDGHFQFELTGPSGAIKDFALSPNGRFVAAVTVDGTLHVWDIEKRTQTHVISGRATSGEESIRFSPDSRRIAATFDNDVRIWQVASGQEVLRLEGHKGPVWAVAFSPDNKLIATGSFDKTARLWDAQTGQLIAALTGHVDPVMKVIFSPDGLFLATATYIDLAERLFLRTSDDRFETRIWNVRSALDMATVAEPMRVFGWKDSPSGRLMVVKDTDRFSTELTASTKLWNSVTGDELRDLRTPGQSVVRTVVSPNGAQVLTISKENEAYLWNASTGERIATLNPKGCCFSQAAFSADGSSIAIAVQQEFTDRDVTIMLFRTNDGQPISTLAGPAAAITRLLFSPDNSRLLAITGGSVEYWNLRHGDRHTVLESAGLPAPFAIFTNGDNRIMTYDGETGVRLWDTEANASVRDWPPHGQYGTAYLGPYGRFFVFTSISDDETDMRVIEIENGREQTLPLDRNDPLTQVLFFPDGARVVLCFAGRSIEIRETTDINCVVVVSSSPGTPTAFAFSPKGSRLAIGYREGGVRVIDTSTGKDLIRLIGHNRPINSISFAADGTRLLTSSDDGSARVWAASTGDELLTLSGHETPVSLAVFAGNGERIVTLGSRKPLRFPDRAFLVDLESGRSVSEIVAPASTADSPDAAFENNSISSIEFSDGGDRMLVKFTDEQLNILDSQGRLVATFKGANIISRSAEISPTGRLVCWPVTLDDESSNVRVVKVDTGELVQSIPIEHGRKSFRFSPDERWLIISSDEPDKTLEQLWSLETGERIVDVTAGKIHNISFAPNSRFMAIISTTPTDSDAESGRFGLTLQDPITRARSILQYDQAGEFSIVFSPNGDYLVKVPGLSADDNATILWNLTSGAKVAELRGERVLLGRSVVFSPDSSILVAYSWGDYADIFRATDGERIGTLEGIREAGPISSFRMTSVEFVDEVRRILTITNHRIVRLWDLATQQKMFEFDYSPVTALDVSLGGTRVITGEPDGTIRLSKLVVSSAELIDLACRLLPAPLSDAQRRQFGLEAKPERSPCNRPAQ